MQPEAQEPSTPELVLVVDDDAASRLMCREALEGSGWRVAEAEDGPPALEAYTTCKPDLILLDVMMPEMDGFTVCSKIRADRFGRHLPILMMTGLEDVDSVNRAYGVGATDFITKPINYVLLSHRVRYMLRAKATSDELRISQERLVNAQRVAKLGNWELDLETNRLYGSQEVRRLLGIPEGVGFFAGRGLLNYVHREDRRKVANAIEAAVEHGRSYSIEHRVVRTDNAVRIVYQEGEISTGADGSRHLIGTIQDITERKLAEKRIEDLAYYDAVTGLPNRASLARQLSQVLMRARRFQRTAALLAVDLDNFKRINDTLGRRCGDQLLRQAAKRLAECIRSIDFIGHEPPELDDGEAPGTIACLGGDEFIVLLSEIRNVEDAAIVARRLNASLQAPFHIEGHELVVTASIGISAYPLDGADAESLLKDAEAAMYHAKAGGRNRYQFYTASMNTRAFERLSMEANLRRAIEQEQLLLQYQPKVRLSDGQTVGAEALLRWQHPDLGLISPADFIPVAEETGLIVPIGLWLLEHVGHTLNAWQAENLPVVPIAVNLSAVQFKQPDLPQSIAELIARVGCQSSLLELELTESLLMEDLDATVRMLEELKSIGLDLSIDDFGTGYSSLSYLKRFPISTLKIDQSFIRDVNADANDAAIVEAVIAMAHSLGLKVVAEGVEYAEQMDFLRERGCDIIQGYYFSRPLDGAKLGDWLRERSTALCPAAADRCPG